MLHKDLENFKVEQALPELLLRKYAKACKSSLNNPCSAVVPWQPPDKLLKDILNKEKGPTEEAEPSKDNPNEDTMEIE